MKLKMEEIKVWDGAQDKEATEKWLEPVLTKRVMSGKDYGLELDTMTVTGKCLGRMRLGINYEKVFPKWLDIRVGVDTKGGVKTTEHLGVDYDATLLDIIDELPRFARFRMVASESFGKFRLTLSGIKSFEESKTNLQEIELRVCELVYHC